MLKRICHLPKFQWPTLLLLVAFVVFWGMSAHAQLSGYDLLTKTEPAAAEEPAAVPAPAPGSELEAYGQIQGIDPGRMFDTATRGVDVFRQRANAVLLAVPDIPSDILATLKRSSPDGDPTFFIGVIIFLGLFLLIGNAFMLLFAFYLARPIMVGMQRPNPIGIVDKLPVLAVRVGITAVGVVITLVVTSALGLAFFDDHKPTQQTAIISMAIYAGIRLIDTAWRMVISPYLPKYRIPSISDPDAVRLYRWMSMATTIGILSIGFVAFFMFLGVKPEVLAALIVIQNTLTATMFLAVALSNRRAIGAAIRGGKPMSEVSWVTSTAAVLWAPIVAVYLIVSVLVECFKAIMGLPGGLPILMAVFLVFCVSMIVYAIIVYVVERFFARARLRQMRIRMRAAEAAAEAARDVTVPADSPDLKEYDGDSMDMDGDGDDEGGATPVLTPKREDVLPPPEPPRPGMRTFEELARRVASLFALGVAGYVLLRIWGGAGIFAENTFFDLLQDTIDILFVGYIAYHALRIWIDRKIEEEGGDDISTAPGDEGGGASAASRLATLLPLVRSFFLVMVVISVGLLVAMRLGVNVAPLFAGAGIIGLAIGFGSQTLVRDILSGMFFLLDDAFRKGEYIDVGEVKGTVEKISLRSFQLRHHLGALNTIPFGEIRHLTNFSRDWVMMKLPLRLTYDTDVDKVRKLIKKLGQQLLEHPTEGAKFVQPLKSQGVYMMEDSAMIIRVKFMTRPGDQWTTRKLVYQNIRELFEREGIKFAHKEVTVRIPDLDSRQLDDDDLKAIGAASRRAIEDSEVATARAIGDDR